MIKKEEIQVDNEKDHWSKANPDTDNVIMFLNCKEGVTYMTIFSMFGVFFTNFSLSSYIFFVMIFFLEEPTTFNMGPEKALSTAAWLVFIGYPFNLAASILSGYLFARYGRRWVIIIGFLIGVTAILLIPFTVT